MKMKPTDLQSGMYITYSVEHNNKLIQSCWSCENTQNIKNVLTKSYIENFSEEPFAIMEKKILCHGHMLLVISKVKRLLEHSMKKSCIKQVIKNTGVKKQPR